MLQPSLTAQAVSGLPLKSEHHRQRVLRLCDSALHNSTAHDELEVLKHMSCSRFAKDCLDISLSVRKMASLDISLSARKMAKRKKKQDTLIGVEKTQQKSRLNFM